jgi:hypothetical protein
MPGNVAENAHFILIMRRFFISLFCLLALGSRLAGEPFSVVVYNAENLFDVDGIALFNDYKPAGPENPEGYARSHFLTKLANTTALMRKFGNGRGPDVILFQEFEGDQTPEKWDGDLVGFLTAHTDVTVETLLTERFDETLAGVPAEVWLYKKMADAGMHEYFVSVAEYRPDPQRPVAHVNVTFSRFPIVESRTHHSPGARGTLETRIDVNGYPLYVFNCHWKSGASNPDTEPTRIGNARVLRERIEEILKEDPTADIIVGGDLNSQYNQSAVFPEMAVTGINTILGAQGDEAALLRPGGPDLYNLWFELPEEGRGSDVFRGHWGTLMHLIVSRGLYDYQGVQYIDNSFKVVRVPGMNADPATGLPLRWAQAGEAGGGFSDHFPLIAWFRVVPDDDSARFQQLSNPSRDAGGPARLRPVDYAGANLELAPNATEIAERQSLQSVDYHGRLLLVESTVSGDRPFRVKVGEEEFQVWSFDENLRRRIFSENEPGANLTFYGELGRHRGNWQFVIHDESWLRVPVATGP